MGNSNRWHMHRMGLVNFWLYDDQEFLFCDGKLMLRGQNASGKSITTQSMIPFILDGDRRPSRLDPFGSSDRKMDYYFLGNTDRNDVTGYLYLEFKREDTEEYRTIGIGQRAQRGKSEMGFWAFLLMDGRRIGKDIHLTKQAGNIYIPLTRQELKNELGETNLFFETGKDYAAAVNKYLFGFPRQEQYEQFIRLLIKVRAPKLDKSFKPSRVYEILNDSLQTLTEEDLRVMVDAMEKMDAIESRLTDLRQMYKDVSVIAKEYDRYNRFMLGKKSQQYALAKKKLEQAQGRLSSLTDELAQYRESVKKGEEEERRIREDIRILEKKIVLWRDSDLHQSVLKRDELVKERGELTKKAELLASELEKSDERIREIEDMVRRYRQDDEVAETRIRRMGEEMDVLAGEMQLSCREEVMRVTTGSETGAEHGREIIVRGREEVRSLSLRVRAAVGSVRELEREIRYCDEEMEHLEEVKHRLDQCRDRLHEVETEIDRNKDELLETWYGMNENNREFVPRRTDIEESVSSLGEDEIRVVSDMIRRYTGEILPRYRDYVRGIYDRLGDAIREKKNALELEKATADKERSEIDVELRELRKQEEPEPERDKDVLRARKALKIKGIPFLSFYEAVDFVPGLSEEQMCRLEKQVRMAGLLDVLVVAEKDRPAATEVLGRFSDVIFVTDAGTFLSETDKNGSRVFRVADGVESEELQKAASAVIGRIGRNRESGAEWVLSEDGYFRHGVTEGFVTVEKDDRVSFIGADTRRRIQEERIAAKEAELAAVEERLHAIFNKQTVCEERERILREEYEAIPSIDGLDDRWHRYRRLEETLGQVQAEYQEQEKKVHAAINRRDTAKKRVIEDCNGLPCERTVESLGELEETADTYLSEADVLLDRMSERERIQVQIREKQIQREDVEDNRFRLEADHRECQTRERVTGETLKEIEVYLADPENRERAEEMSHADRDLDELRGRLEKVLTETSAKRERLSEGEGRLSGYQEELLSATKREKALAEYLLEEKGLHLCEESEKEAEESAPDSDKNEAEMASTLTERFLRHSSSALEQGLSMNDRFEASAYPDAVRKRREITVLWMGNRIPIGEYAIRVEEQIEETQMLIREKDRELFENILSDTVSRKLSDRISESRAWIRDMSRLMKGMNTSMGLSFELRWRPTKSESREKIGAEELEKLLRRDKELLTAQDIERLAGHFRSHIHDAKRQAEESGAVPNYYEMVRDILDYRKWFEFHMMYIRGEDEPKELTDRAFNRFSGGEKAMAMYVPLFAAVNAQYRKSSFDDFPRLLALDEAFAGVDEINIGSMFELVETLDFDYIMNSQFLWGCYETVPSLRIAELLRPENAQEVTVINYRWDGKQRVLEE